MPEGPEVRVIAHSLKNTLCGQMLYNFWRSDKSLRKPIDEAKLIDLEYQYINDVTSYGKVLFIYINNEPQIKIQLGMSGQLIICDKQAKVLSHTHIRWPLKDHHQELRYIDPRRFGVFSACDSKDYEKTIKHLGPDPFLFNKSHYQTIIDRAQKSHRTIKAILLDQTIIAGVGNIYAAEALFLAGIHPESKACNLSNEQYHNLFDAVLKVMQQSFAHGGTSFSNYVDAQGQKGSNINLVNVFKREHKPCLACGTAIKKITQHGRSTCFCPKCQSHY